MHISRSLNSVCDRGNYMTNINLSEARMKYDNHFYASLECAVCEVEV